jgi:PAS domain S-box-containing protein
MQRLAEAGAMGAVADDALLLVRWRDVPGRPVDALSPQLASFLEAGVPERDAHGDGRGALSLDAIIHPDDHARFVGEIARARAGGADRVRHGEHRITGRDGRVAWWDTFTVIRTPPSDPDDRGTGAGVVAGGEVVLTSHAFDVTAIRDGRAPPPVDREGDDHQRLLLHSTGDGIYGIDNQGRFMFANPAAARLLGFDAADELMGRQVCDVIRIRSPADRPSASFAMDSADCRIRGCGLEGQAAGPVEAELWRKDGGWFVAELRSFPVLRDGAWTGAVVTFQDVTGRRRSQETLRLLWLAVEQSPVAVVIADVHGTVRYINPRFGAMTGMDRDAVADMDSFALAFIPPEAEPHGALRRRLAAGEAWHGEFPTSRADGTLFWAEVTITPVRGDNGQITHFIGMAEDVTGRRQAEEHIRRAQKMQAVGVLAGGIAHDFNNILTAILGYSHLVRDALPAGSELCDDVARIAQAAGRAKGLVQQLMAFSRKEKIGREAVDLRIVVDEGLRLLPPALPPHVQVVVHAGPEPLPVLVARTQFQQLVVNLCRNALDSLGAGPGTVTLTLAIETFEAARELARTRVGPGRHAVLTVTDTGCGMDTATLERIFEPFFTTKPVDKGTGLGLAAAHGIVTDHGGVIDVVSAPGAGTSFRVLLPVCDPAAPVPPPVLVRGPRVLLTGAAGPAPVLLAGLMRAQGFKVVATAGVRRALALFALAPGRFDLVVLVQGGGEPPWRLLTRARAFAASSPGVPIVLCGDHDMERESAATHAAGVTRVIRFPVDPPQFLSVVRQLVEDGAGRERLS